MTTITPEICGNINIAHPTSLLLGRRMWKTYFVSLHYSSSIEHRPILLVKRKSEEYIYVLTGSNVIVEKPKLTKLGHSRGKRTIVLEDAITKTPWLYLAAKDTEQHKLWIRNLRKMLPKHTNNARKERMQLRAIVGVLAKPKPNDAISSTSDSNLIISNDNNNKETRFSTLDNKGIDTMMALLCQRTAEKCDISTESALALLRSTRWNWPALATKLNSDKNAVFSSIGLSISDTRLSISVSPTTATATATATTSISTINDNSETKTNQTTTTSATETQPIDLMTTTTTTTTTTSTTTPEHCEICYDDFVDIASNTIAMECNHRFCTNCWKDHVRNSMAAGAQNIWKVGSICPQYDCLRYVPSTLYLSLLDTDMDRNKYEQYLRNHFVENCPLLTWCSSKLSCNHAIVISPQSVTQSVTHPNNATYKTNTATCNACNHVACFKCGQEAGHGIVTCEQSNAWLKYYSILEEALAGTKESKDNDEKWLAEHTRPCPNCKSPIQRNFGCNHMTCNCCSHEFCWVCMQPWSIHGTQTGGYFRCDVNNEKSTQEKLKELRAEQLEKGTGRSHAYTHYFKRGNTTTSKAATNKISDQVLPSKQIDLSKIILKVGSLGIQLRQCLIHGEKQLMTFRSALRWFYVLHWNIGSNDGSLHGNLLITYLRAFEILLDHYQQLLHVPIESVRGGLIPSNKSIQESVARVQTFGIETAHAFQELEMFAVMLRDIVGAENEQKQLKEVSRPPSRAQTIDSLIEEMLGGLRIPSGEQNTSNSRDSISGSSKTNGNGGVSSSALSESKTTDRSTRNNTVGKKLTSLSSWKDIYYVHEINPMNNKDETDKKKEESNRQLKNGNWSCVLCNQTVQGNLKNCTLCNTRRYPNELTQSILNKLIMLRKFWSFDKRCIPKIKKQANNKNHKKNYPDHFSDSRTEWSCVHCSTVNERFRTRCQSCTARRYKKENNSAVARQRQSPRPIIPWSCLACTFINPANERRCGMCRGPATVPDSIASTTDVNLESFDDIQTTEQMQHDLLPAYSCTACTFANEAGVMHCEICMTPRGQ